MTNAQLELGNCYWRSFLPNRLFPIAFLLTVTLPGFSKAVTRAALVSGWRWPEPKAATNALRKSVIRTGWLGETAGLVVSPGELYGDASDEFVRVAMVQPDERLALVCDRLAGA